ncbi:MAG: hypothetical protein K2L64_00710, partial [Ureaplasma sp.]|nr:hypothetical protein [Ureaplasma sp.]
MYKFVLNSSSVENLSISNFNFFADRKLVKLDSLHNAIKNEINSKQFTPEQFANYVQSNNSTVKNLVAQNLYVSDSEKISSSEIKSVSYNNDNLVVTLTPPSNTKYTIVDNDNISLENNILTIKNLNYYRNITLTRLNSLFSAVQSEIKNKKYTSSEFAKYVETNNITLKNIIVSNIYISNTTTINANQVSTISYDNGIVKIQLSPLENTKYSIDDSDANITFSNNVLSINSLSYATIINFTKLDSLFNAVQNEINNQKQTADEFNNYVLNQNEQIKTIVTNNLFIGSNTTIQANQISSVSTNNNNLEITLENIELIKYSADTNNNISLVNDKLIISGLSFYTINKLTNLSTLHSAIQNEITTRKFTSSEFSNFMNTNSQVIKNIIVDNLYVNSNVSIDSGLISSVTYFNGSLRVNLVNQNKVKYAIDTNSNFSLSDNVLTISNFNYFSIVNLSNL